MTSHVLTFAAGVFDRVAGDYEVPEVPASLRENENRNLQVHLPQLSVKVFGIDEAGMPQELNLQNACVALGGTGTSTMPICDMFACEDATTAEMKETSMTFDGNDECAYFTLAFLVAGNPMQSQSVLKVKQKMDLHARLYLPAHEIVSWIKSVGADPHAARTGTYVTGLTDVNSKFSALQWQVTLQPNQAAEASAQQIPHSLVQKFKQQTLSVPQLQKTIAYGSRQRRDAIASAAANTAGPQPPELRPVQLPNGMLAVMRVAYNIEQEFKQAFITIPVEHNWQVELVAGMSACKVLQEQKLTKQQAMLQANQTGKEMSPEMNLNQIDWKAANALMEAHAGMHADYFVGHLLAGMTLATSLRMRALNTDVNSAQAVREYLKSIPTSTQERRLFYAYLVDAVQMQTAADGRYAYDSTLTGLLQSKFTVRDEKGRKQVKMQTLVQTSTAGEHQQFAGMNSNADRLMGKNAGVLGDCEDVAIHQKNVLYALTTLPLGQLQASLAQNLGLAKNDVQQFKQELTDVAIALSQDLQQTSAQSMQTDSEFTVSAPMICTANAANQASDQSNHSNGERAAPPTAQEWDERRRGPMTGHAAGAFASMRTRQVLESGVVVREMLRNSIKEGTASSFQLADSNKPWAQVKLESNDALIASKLASVQGVMTEAQACSIRSELWCNSIESRKLMPKNARVSPCMIVNTAEDPHSFYKGIYALGNHVMACRNKAGNQLNGSTKLCPSAPCNDGNVEVLAFEAPMNEEERKHINHLARLEAFLYNRPSSSIAKHILSPASHRIGDQFNFENAVIVSHEPSSHYMQQTPKKQGEMRKTFAKKIGASAGCFVISPNSIAYGFLPNSIAYGSH